MTSPDVIAICAALGTLITIMGGVIIKITFAIKRSVDGTADAAKATIAELRTEIAFLRELVADHKQVAAVLAEATAQRPRRMDADGRPVPVEVVNTPLATHDESRDGTG
jgi:hypothetical protein